MAFRWRADDSPTLNAGLVALWFFRGSGPVLLRNPIFSWFSRGEVGPPVPTLDLRMQIAFDSPCATPRENLTLFRAKNEDADIPSCYKQRFSILVHCTPLNMCRLVLSHYNVPMYEIYIYGVPFGSKVNFSVTPKIIIVWHLYYFRCHTEINFWPKRYTIYIYTFRTMFSGSTWLFSQTSDSELLKYRSLSWTLQKTKVAKPFFQQINTENRIAIGHCIPFFMRYDSDFLQT